MLEVGIFAAKTGIIIFGIAFIIILIAFIAMRSQSKTELQIEPIHKNMEELEQTLKSVTLSKEELKQEKKKQKAKQKAEDKKSTLDVKKIFVINFNGDMKASQVENLRKEITSVLQVASIKDEVVVKVESPGGVVHGYGLAASQLLRIRERKIPLTICVDKVAASGGYMMACVANKIVAAPFAILGSIGVVAQVPNFNKILKKYDVDYKEYTAGEFKRTVSILGEITPKGEQKFLEQLEDTHKLFKEFVGTHRPQIRLDDIATGEHWYGERAKIHGLIDEISTSDDYLLKSFEAESPIYEIKYEQKKGLSEKISDMLGKAALKIISEVSQQAEKQRFF